MDPLPLVVLRVGGSAAGFALFVYILYRGVLFAKKPGRAAVGAELMGNALMFLTWVAVRPTQGVRLRPSCGRSSATKMATAIRTRTLNLSAAHLEMVPEKRLADR
jgi:hypothetical protein